MKPIMMFSIAAVAGIILASVFGLRIMPPVHFPLPADAAGSALFVCPMTGGVWGEISSILSHATRQIVMVFMFIALLVIFSWGWALYQNLLKDKFVGDAYKKPWQMTKMLLWAAAIMTVLIMTPNYFRSVHVAGASGEWILCEESDPGAIAVRASAVKA